MKKLILIAALFAACNKTVPVQNQNTVNQEQVFSDDPATGDTVSVQFKIKETPVSQTKARMSFIVFIKEGSVDVDVDVTVRWRLGDHLFIRTVTILKGKTSVSTEIEGEYLAPFSIEGDYITSVTPKQTSKYKFNF